MSTVYPTSIQLAERQPTIALSIVLKAWKWAIVQLSVNYTCETDGWVSCFNFLGNTVHELDMPWWPECWAGVEVLNTAGHTIRQVRQCTCPLWRFWCCSVTRHCSTLCSAMYIKGVKQDDLWYLLCKCGNKGNWTRFESQITLHRILL